MNVARAMKDRLAERYGGSLHINGVTYRAFPQPFQLALSTTDELNTILHNTRKAECMNAVAQSFANIDELWLREAPLEQVKSWLPSIKGIGAWSASFVLLRGLGRIERVPVDEKRLLEAARRVYERNNLTFNDLPQLAAPFTVTTPVTGRITCVWQVDGFTHNCLLPLTLRHLLYWCSCSQSGAITTGMS